MSERALSYEPSKEVTHRDGQEAQRDKQGNRGLEKTTQAGYRIELRGVRMFDKPLSPVLEDIGPFHSSLSRHAFSFVCFNLFEPNIWYASYRKIRADTD